ncbi:MULTISPECIES: SH3-like domain-containing protein [unclassified Mycobacterium]|uniref:SH3-like domain-containing protein n=1 Tax=unclassified Mycobacterium TaxID=2642494 RepID=UPI0029C68E08|nr:MULTISPECIES: SH3-like domain-containing protein [unclassified Mycobacterium]
MTTEPASIDADLEGPISPPRDNGELVFSAPWERRVFGLTVAVCRSGACDWEGFRAGLIARIAHDESRPYWENWAAALQDVLERDAVVTRADIDNRHRELSSRRAGFDHHA